MTRGIDYHRHMQDALLQVFVSVLSEVAENGLPGDHHLLIAVDTTHPGVVMPDWLREKYPREIRLLLQNWFEDLSVAADRFAVTLSFNNQPERLVVPMAAVRSFVDPSVEFGLRFDQSAEAPGDAPPPPPDKGGSRTPKTGTKAPGDGTGSVVSLDRFRR